MVAAEAGWDVVFGCLQEDATETTFACSTGDRRGFTTELTLSLLAVVVPSRPPEVSVVVERIRRGIREPIPQLDSDGEVVGVECGEWCLGVV